MADPVISPTVASAIIGASVSGAQSIGNGVIGLLNNKYNKEQNEWNKNFAQSQFDYTKSLNQQLMEREDNAVQRRAADLKKAGISKNLAVGQAAQASTVQSSNTQANAQQRKASNFEKQIISDELAKRFMEKENLKANEKAISSQDDLNKSNISYNSEKERTEQALQNMYKSEKNMYDSQADYYNSEAANNKHNLWYAGLMKMPVGLSARASNKYELLSSIAQNLLIRAWESKSTSNYQELKKEFDKKLEQEGVKGKDKHLYLEQFEAEYYSKSRW